VFAGDDAAGLCSFDPQSERWKNGALPSTNQFDLTNMAELMTAPQEWIRRTIPRGATRNVSVNLDLFALNGAKCLAADEIGFWFETDRCLHFYDSTNRLLKSWLSPRLVPGFYSQLMGISYTGGSQITQGSLDAISEQIQKFMKKLQQDRAKIHEKKERAIDPLNLNSRFPGDVTAMANDGDYLWMGIGSSVFLLHKPSASLAARFDLKKWGRIISILPSRNSVWVGTESDLQLLELSKDAFLSVPRSQWVTLAISPDERNGLIQKMSVRDRALYAFYAGDDQRVVELLGQIDPAKATLEELFLCAFSCDTSGIDNPAQAQSWFEHIMREYPNSAWAQIAKEALSANADNHQVKAHAAALVERFDSNHDGVLDAKETKAMKSDPQYQQEQKIIDKTEQDVQIKAIFERYDGNKNGKLEPDEISSLVVTVRAFSEASPAILAGRKILVAPLMTKNFPTVPALLKKYDLDHDGALSLSELAALANDIHGEN
jgi:Ca2+-binding EF-hand superfamily protein